MFDSVQNGLKKEGFIQGKLKLKRVAKSMYQQAMNTRKEADRERLFIMSYSYAVSEENADGGMVVTAPTCGASGVVPAILYFCYKHRDISKKDLVKALAVGGLFGNIIKRNATISGADGGCQAEIGSACAMASAMMAWNYELNNSLIEYAAEMGLEHNLGLTCDPVGGYVQIPCIERNGFASLRAFAAAMLAKQLGYLRKNKVSFDTIVKVMHDTGRDLSSDYKETSLGGLAKEFGL
jgi:L-serine dehydratase